MVRNAVCVLGISLGAGVLAAANCASATFHFGGADTASTIEVAAGAPLAEGAAAVEFQLFDCGAERARQSATVPVRAASLGQLPSFVDVPLDAQTPHGFSDHVFEVDAGCYRISARAVDALERPLDSCAPVHTPDTYIDPGHHQQYAMLAGCEATAGEPIAVGRQVNHAPEIAEVAVERRGLERTCETVEICATARDADGDALVMHWSHSPRQGDALSLPEPRRTHGPGHLTECVSLEPGQGLWDFEVSVRDLTEDTGKRRASRQDSYIAQYGLVASSSDARSFEVETRCNASSCPDDPRQRITEPTYWITRDGELLAPTDDLSEVRAGDMVDVEFGVADGCEHAEVTFASYTSSHPEEARRDEPASVFTRTYGSGTHLLWNVLPDCPFVVDLHVGAPLGGEERSADGNPYGSRLIDSAAGGDGACNGGSGR